MSRYFLGLLIVIAGTAACLKNPFETRSSSQPAGSTGTWETPSTPEIMITNLLFAYNEKNILNYQLCFSEDFTYSAYEDSIEAEAHGNGYLFYDWTKVTEQSTAENIFTTFSQSGNSLSLVMTGSQDYSDDLTDTSAILYREYTLTAVISDSLGADTSFVEGLTAFYLNHSAFNLWTIYYWQELPSGTSSYSWGDFKAEYRNR